MFNPGELEGEVDHSFFDSDCDDSTGNGGKRKSVKAEKESQGGRTKHTENAKGDISPRTNKTRKNLKQVEKDSGSRVEKKERSRVSSVSSVSCVSDKVVGRSTDGECDSNVQSKRPDGSFMALLADAREVDDKDVYSQSTSETDEDALSFSATKKRKNKLSPKKLIRSRRTRSPSPTSTDTSADADADSECSYSGGSRRSSLASPALRRPNESSSCAGVRRTRRGSAGSRDLPDTCTDESEDTVTDVSPLSSSDTSPLQSLDLKHTEVEERSHEEQQHPHPQQEEESVPSGGLSSMHRGEDSDQDVDDYSLSLESQLESKLVFHCPGGRNRKNYSFTNDEVRRIDRENQRLLRELSRASPGSRPGTAVGKKTHVASNSPLIRLSHSALNRQRERQRIEKDNLAFLKRLESVKPTPGMRRSEQLADYQRHVGYLGAPSYPICLSATGKERSSTRTSSACPRPTRPRTAFTGTDSSSTPVTRSKKLSAPRPAWC